MRSEQQFAIKETSIWSLCKLKTTMFLSLLNAEQILNIKEVGCILLTIYTLSFAKHQFDYCFWERKVRIWKTTRISHPTYDFINYFINYFFYVWIFLHCQQGFYFSCPLTPLTYSAFILDDCQDPFWKGITPSQKIKHLILQTARMRRCQLSVPLPNSVLRLSPSISYALTYGMCARSMM